MSDQDVLPELKQIIGAMLFASKTPITVGDIRRCLEQVAESAGGPARDFGAVTPEDIRTALEALTETLQNQKAGFHVVEVAHGFRLENDANCGMWLRHLLQKGRPNRLSKPALETLAIIAYRQPCTRAEIEAVRGVAVDQILRNLMDMQLIRITGRSELPGRPWMFGTAQKFLEYFGLRDVKELPGVEELRRMEEEQERKRKETPVEAAEPVLQLETPEGTVPDAASAPEAAASDQEEPASEPAAEGEDEEAAEEAAEEVGEDEDDDGDDDDEDEYDDDDDDDDDDDEDDDEDEEDEDDEEDEEKS
jgi:segregation and condensation protein B